MLRQILLYDFGELTQLIDRIEQFRHLVRKYEEQSGESVTDNVRQLCSRLASRTRRSGTIWLSMRVDSTPSTRLATEVSTVARTRNENDIVPMDVSVLKGKGGKGKDGKSEDGKNKDGKGEGEGQRWQGQD